MITKIPGKKKYIIDFNYERQKTSHDLYQLTAGEKSGNPLYCILLAHIFMGSKEFDVIML